jgi:DNA-binding NarL/FixJ family response regulator
VLLADILAEHYEVVGAVMDGREAVRTACDLKPDLVVLDIGMPERDGLQAAEELKRLGSAAKVVFLTLQEDQEYVAALDGGGLNGHAGMGWS